MEKFVRSRFLLLFTQYKAQVLFKVEAYSVEMLLEHIETEQMLYINT